jgi:hypothetical protein
MALPDLNWRYVGTRTFVGGNLVAALNAAYDLGIAVTYSDGTVRVPGTGSAWTWAREQSAGTTVAAYGNPPTNALAFRYIIGGTVGASAPTMLTPDAFLANCILYGMQRNAGAFTTWTSATPFTNAGFSGYWKGTRPFSVLQDSVAMWESQEGCAIQWGLSSDGSTSTVGFGALIDPLSVAAANAESDGRLYMMFGSGVSFGVSTVWASLTGGSSGGTWGGGGSTNGANHAGVFAPGTAVMYGGAGNNCSRLGTFTALLSSTNGATPLINVVIQQNNTGTFFLGQSRQWYITENQVSRIALNLGGTFVGWICGASLNSAANCVVLTP